MNDAKLKKLADRFRASKDLTDIELAEAERRFDSFLDRRNKSQDRLIVGGLAINATSATALFAAMQTGQETLSTLHIPSATTTMSLGMFIAGVLVAVVAHWSEQIIISRWAADHYSNRLVPLRNKRALLEKADTEENVEDLRKADREVAAPADFRFNWVQMALSHLSGSFWMVGICNVALPVWLSSTGLSLG